MIGCVTKKPVQTNRPFTNLTQADLQQIAELKYGFDLKEKKLCDLFIVDGIPFDQTNIDSLLSQYDKTDFGLILMFELEENQTYIHRNCDVLTLIRTKPQPNKEKSKIFSEVREIYNDRVSELIITDYQCADCLLMTVNDKIVWNPYERKRIVNELRIDQIEYIANIRQPLNIETFGRYGKNGIVEITSSAVKITSE